MDKEFIDTLKVFAEQLNELSAQAHKAYKPEVDRLIQSKTTNDNEIQRLLDYMLDFCGDSKMLQLYKKLCRYYWDINPQATAQYINYYREMWDNNTNDNNET